MVAPAVATAVYAKEIAFELDFPNLSFFGKYFKARKGVSPRLYRTAWLHTQGNLQTTDPAQPERVGPSKKRVG